MPRVHDRDVAEVDLVVAPAVLPPAVRARAGVGEVAVGERRLVGLDVDDRFLNLPSDPVDVGLDHPGELGRLRFF